MQKQTVALTGLEDLSAKLRHLHTNLIMNGVSPVPPASESISRFLCSSSEIQEQILQNLTKYISVINEEIVPTNPLKDKDLEVARLKKALSVFGFRAADDGIFNQIEEDDVVEFYNSEGVQLYRNISFLKVCSYSLLDLAVHPWDQLYEKPALVTNQIHEKIKQVLTKNTRTLPFEIPPFVQKEKFAFAKKLQAYIVQAKYLSPLENILTGHRTAFIITFKGTLLADGQESLKINIL